MNTKVNNIVEGVYAHSYSDDQTRQEIKKQYDNRHTKLVDPNNDPLSFDPLKPPSGWAYDPYYELWIQK